MRIRVLASLAAGAALVALPAVAAPEYGGYHDGHMWGGEWHGWVFGPMMMAFWLIVLAGIVLLVLRMLGSAGSGGRGSGKQESDALDILRERFARGEIDEAEFDARRKVLER